MRDAHEIIAMLDALAEQPAGDLEAIEWPGGPGAAFSVKEITGGMSLTNVAARQAVQAAFEASHASKRERRSAPPYRYRRVAVRSCTAE